MRRLQKRDERNLFSRIGKGISRFAGTAVLAAGLALAPASVNSGPARTPVMVNVKGTRAKQVKLKSTLAGLDRKSKPYRKGAWRVVVPNSKLDAKVTLNRGAKEVVVKHPNPVSGGAALTKKVNLTNFARLVKKVSRKDMKKVKLLVTTAKQMIVHSRFTKHDDSIYVLPLDRSGRTIGKYQQGNLAVKISYSRVPLFCASKWASCKNAPHFKATIKSEVVLLKQPATTTRCKAWDVNCLKQKGKSESGPGSGGNPGGKTNHAAE